MIVVGIIGLVAAMGAPALNKMLQKEGMRKALSDIEDVCFSAREQAIVFNKTTAVVFEELWTHMHPTDRLFVLKAAREASWLNAMCDDDWLKENL